MGSKRVYKLVYDGEDLPVSDDQAMTRRYEILLREANGLFIEKNNAYKSVFVEYGTIGVFVRIRDKLARLFSDSESVGDEGIVEDFLDIANYAIMGAMINQFDLKRGAQCDHLYRVVGEEKLSCINCDEEMRL